MKTKTKTKTRAEQPETLSQAQYWETLKNRALKLGLCYRCAAQAAYGAQLGYSRVHPPCNTCLPIVLGTPSLAGWVPRAVKTGDSLPI